MRTRLTRICSIMTVVLAVSACDEAGTAKPTEKPGCRIVLYHDAGFAGPSIPMEADFDNLRNTEVHNQVSSFVVEKGTWELFADEGFGQSVGSFPKGSRVANAPRNDEIDSGRCKPS